MTGRRTHTSGPVLSSPNGVDSLQFRTREDDAARWLDVLEALTLADRPMRVEALAGAAGLYLAHVVRAVEELVADGLVVRCGDTFRLVTL